MGQTSPTIFRRETIPLNSMMAENPHYEVQHTSSNSESKEDRDKVAMPLMLSVHETPDYQVILSSCLEPLKELGEGVFGKVHLATYCTSPDSEAEKFLVAVSILDRVSLLSFRKILAVPCLF